MYIRADPLILNLLENLNHEIEQVVGEASDYCENIGVRYHKNETTRTDLIAIRNRLNQLQKVATKISDLKRDLDKGKVDITLKIELDMVLEEIIRELYKQGKCNIPNTLSPSMNSHDLHDLKKIIISNLEIVERNY